MRKDKLKHKLSSQLLGAIVISLIVAILIIISCSRIIAYFLEKQDPNNLSVTVYYILAVFIFLILVGTFITTFIILISKKIRYIKLVSNSIHEIANGEIGKTIKLRGNDELTQLVESINYMSKELQDKFNKERELEQEKNELITNISHDLRTPLTSIIGYLDLLKRGHYSSQQQFQDYLDITHQKSQRLKILIDELFEYTRLSSPDITLNKNEVDIGDLLEQIVGEYIPIIEKEQLKVNKSIEDIKLPVLMDVDKLVRVFDNLLSNAIKYSDKPSEIMISLHKKEGYACFQIINKVDIPLSQDINKLFERFYTGNQARLENNGTGLGLAITKKIVELHSGKITAVYKNKEIVFKVILPLSSNV